MRRLHVLAVEQEVDPEVVARVYTAMIDGFIELEHREYQAHAAAATVPGRRLISSASPYEPTIGFSRAVCVGDRVLVSGTGPVWPDGSCPADAGA